MLREGRPAARGDALFGAAFSMAFQPIVDVAAGRVLAYEALVRGQGGEGARSVLDRVSADDRGAFDQACRAAAVALGARLGLPGRDDALLSINFMPNAIQDPVASIHRTMVAVGRARFPPSRLLFEFNEGEPVEPAHLGRILATYKSLRLKTAIDDFGAGYSGLTLLAKFQPDVVKLDMELVRGIDSARVKQVLVKAVVDACREIGVTVVAEGIETVAEHTVLRDIGVTLQQGYLFARPGFERLPVPVWPRTTTLAA